jgi:hypothetical protein
MSCDYAVWHTASRLSNDTSASLYARLCERDTSGVIAHAGIESFYNELTEQHPELDDIPEDQLDDSDLCPWSVAFDRSPGHIIMCCVWPKAEYVGDLVARLASKHGLTFYDPQSGRVVYPADAPSSKPWWKFW